MGLSTFFIYINQIFAQMLQFVFLHLGWLTWELEPKNGHLQSGNVQPSVRQTCQRLGCTLVMDTWMCTLCIAIIRLQFCVVVVDLYVDLKLCEF